MTDEQRARLDVATLREVAGAFDEVAGSAGAAARTRVGFDGATAGRAHTGDGEALRRAVDALLTGVAGWAHAAEEVAAGLRVSLGRLSAADDAAAAGIGLRIG